MKYSLELHVRFLFLASFAFVVGFSSSLSGDDYHYKNILIGERASGLGGSYAAISDDPSGIYYNPAGIVFGLESYLSVSANALQTSSQVFEHIYPGQHYEYQSLAFVPVLFGFIQSYGDFKFGLAVIVPNYDLIDQNDTVRKEKAPTSNEIQFTRKFFKQDITYLAGPAVAWELDENLSIGVSLLGMARMVKLIDNTLILYEPIGTGEYYVYNAFLNRMSLGAYVKVGVQYMPLPKLSLGATIGKPFNMSGSGEARIVSTNSDTDNTPVSPNGTFNTDITQQDISNVFHEFPSPLATSLSAAYFFDREFLITAQLDFYFPQEDYREFSVAGTLDWALGTEYFITESIALRGALFSNNANTHDIDETLKNQPPKVNMLCGTFGVTLYRSGTSLTMGVIYQMGVGKGQAFSDLNLVQRVKQNSMGIYIAGSYQL